MIFRLTHNYGYSGQLLKWVLLLLFCNSSIYTYAGKIDKAFSALQLFDYFNARNDFNSSFAKYPCISGYGLSLIYNRDDNPFFNVDSAYFYIISSRDAYALAGKRELSLLATYNVDQAAILKQADAIDENAFNLSRKNGDTTAFNHFINNYPASRFLDQATRSRDSVLYAQVRLSNDPVKIKWFADTYPDSYLHTEATSLYERVLYQEMTAGGSLEEYESFLVMYPKSPYRKEADEAMYRISIGKEGTVKEYHDFIIKHPESAFVEHAWSRIYDLFMSDYSDDSFIRFKDEFPDYPYQDRLMEDYVLSATRMLPFRKDSLYGFINNSGEVKVQPIYEAVGEYSEGLCLVYKNNKAGYISKSGDEIIPAFYDEAEPFHNNVAIVTESGISGVIDRNGKMLIPLSYDEISDYEDGLAAASKSGVFGFIDKNGKTVIPFIYETAGPFNEGTAVCMLQGKYGIINTSGNTVVPFEYDAVENFRNGVARVRQGDKWGLVNKESQIVVAPVYDDIGIYSSGRALVVLNKKAGYIDTTGTVIIPLIYDTPPDLMERSGFINNRAVIRSNGKYGVIDLMGKKTVPFRFQEMSLLSDTTLFAVKLNGKWGVTDRTGLKAVIPFRYDGIVEGVNHHFIVWIKQRAGLISTSGKKIIDFNFEYLNMLNDSLLISGNNGLFGLISISGKVVLPEVYTRIDKNDGDFLKLKIDQEIEWYDINQMNFIWQETPSEK